jgi:hypothetical protein
VPRIFPYSISIDLTPDIVQRLDIKALPYVIFMIVPVLGRMSDSDDDIRSISTNTFAALVKMVPLEVRQCLQLIYYSLLRGIRLAFPILLVSLRSS